MVQYQGWRDPLEKEIANHSSILAWKTPRRKESNGLQSMELQSWTQLSNFHYYCFYEFENSVLLICQLPPTLSRDSTRSPSELQIFADGDKFTLRFIQKGEHESGSVSGSLMLHSLHAHGLHPTRLLCPWDCPGKDTGVICHFFLHFFLPVLQEDSLPTELPGNSQNVFLFLKMEYSYCLISKLTMKPH